MPMNVAAKPDPGIETNGELKPVASALASIVLPVPGAPRKRRPRSRLPPARSNASPDCQIVTTRRTSSFASACPRTSSIFTPHSASPGSKDCICAMFMRSRGPIRIAKFEMNRKETKTTWIQSPELLKTCAIPWPSEPNDPVHEPPWNSQMAVTSNRNETATRSQKCQNQARRRPSTSSSRCRSLSRPKRLGQGMNRRKTRSTRPRNAITISRVTPIAFHSGQ